MDDAKTRARRQILEVAAGILQREGTQAVSTRSVAAAAGIRAASLYQLFGDKDGLLAALAIHAFDIYLAEKPAADEANDLLLKFLDRAAAAGCLRVLSGVAARLCLAAVTGVTLSLIGAAAEDRDPEISARMRDTLTDTLTTDPPPAADPGLASRALALDAALTAADGTTLPLRPTETTLLRDWLHLLAR